MRAQSGAVSVATPASSHARSAGSNPAPRSMGTDSGTLHRMTSTSSSCTEHQWR